MDAIPAAGAATFPANEAVRAIDVLPAGATAVRVARYSAIALAEAVRMSADATRYLVSLVELVGADPDLLGTLTAFYGNGRRRRQTAEALGIHLNTLNYRLGRIEKILDASLDDTQCIAQLDIAQKLAGGAAPA